MRLSPKMSLLVILLVAFSAVISGQNIPFEIRFCVPEDIAEHCKSMANSLPGSITCVTARDRFDCMNLVARDQADVLNVDAEDLYLAGRIYNLEPFAMEEVDSNLHRYRAGVLIHKNLDIASLSDLRGKRSCHTGMGRTAGWSIPIGQLLQNNVMVPDCRSELHSVANFFVASCAPGRWSADANVDQQMKKEHSSLCGLCKDPSTCGAGDAYAGYEGAIKCLVEGSGQVAFTTVEAVDKFFRENVVSGPDGLAVSADDYQFLCLDGTRMPVTRRACDWSRRPSNTFVIRKGKVRQKETYLRFLQQVFYRYRPYKPTWFSRSFVSSPNVTNLVAIAYSQQNWESYLGNYIPSIEKPMPGCERKNVTFCTRSTKELSKCLDMQKVAYSRRVRPDVRCVNPGDSLVACVEAINDRRADVMSLGPSDLYAASRYSGLVPIARENTNLTDTAHYAVALVRLPSEVTTLSELRGLRSCHGGFGTPSGWVAPISALLEADLIPRDTCNRAAGAAAFFSESCAPGAADYRFNANVTGAEALCKACIGSESGAHVCERDHYERYEGEGGAMRCLAEGRGDVAFVSHFTPFLFVDGMSSTSWARGLRSEQFRLVCGGEGGQGALKDFEKCNLGKVPTHYIVTADALDEEKKMDIIKVLSDLSDTFTRKAPTSFKLFGKFDNESDLVFADVSTGIVGLEGEPSYQDVLGDFYPALQDMDEEYCENGSNLIGGPGAVTVLTMILALVLSLRRDN